MHAGRKQMHEKGRQEFEAKFKAADKDGDGALSKQEAETGKLERIVKHFDAIDANKDAKVTMDELHAARKAMHKHHKGKFDEKFKSADKDGDGALSKQEAETASMKRLVADFDKADANKDGKVTREELQAAMRKGPPPAAAK